MIVCPIAYDIVLGKDVNFQNRLSADVVLVIQTVLTYAN